MSLCPRFLTERPGRSVIRLHHSFRPRFFNFLSTKSFWSRMPPFLVFCHYPIAASFPPPPPNVLLIYGVRTAPYVLPNNFDFSTAVPDYSNSPHPVAFFLCFTPPPTPQGFSSRSPTISAGQTCGFYPPFRWRCAGGQTPRGEDVFTVSRPRAFLPSFPIRDPVADSGVNP